MERGPPFIWPKGDYFLHHFIPLDFDPCKSQRTLKPTIDAAQEFLDICVNNEYGNFVSKADWDSAVITIGVEKKIADIIFQNCFDESKNAAAKEQLVFDIFFLVLEDYSYNGLKKLQTHDDVVCELLRELITDVASILLRSADDFRNTKYAKFAVFPIEERTITKLEMFDLVFEGTITRDLEDVVPFSKIMETISSKKLFPVSLVISTLRKLLISNPFNLNDLSLPHNPLYLSNGDISVLKQTSLAHIRRRRVVVRFWKHLQALRKGVYNKVHIRISNNQPNASYLFMPWTSQTAFIEHVRNCQGIVLGPTQKIVLIHECSNTSITCFAESIIIWKCQNIQVFLAAKQSVIIRESENIKLAPYNVTYTEFREQVNYAGMSMEMIGNFKNIKPILLDESSWQRIEPSNYYIQPVPFERKEEDAKLLLTVIPECYRTAWKEFLDTADRSKAKEYKLPKRDALYLRSKIATRDDIQVKT
ncbi:unnamed protein product [Auanema sp. JU1783]|nr:unnamed protein product [Auanema sp. JU1783]